jgi:hypothetical protein
MHESQKTAFLRAAQQIAVGLGHDLGPDASDGEKLARGLALGLSHLLKDVHLVRVVAFLAMEHLLPTEPNDGQKPGQTAKA